MQQQQRNRMRESIYVLSNLMRFRTCPKVLQIRSGGNRKWSGFCKERQQCGCWLVSKFFIALSNAYFSLLVL